MEGIKVIPNMLLLDKTGSPASMGTVTTSRILEVVLLYSLDLRLVLEDVRANCVVDDYIEVMCSVEVIRDGAPTPPPSSSEQELLDLGHDLAMLSDKQQLTDVSFDVDGGELQCTSPHARGPITGLQSRALWLHGRKQDGVDC
jgi:hypothetical protein